MTDPFVRPFGDYELLEHVGHGGMAEVWLARRAVVPGGLKPCALKIIHGRFANKPRYRRMFLQEARLALKLRHANVVSVFDAGEVDGRLYMALEWVDGVDLRRFAQCAQETLGPLGVPVVCHVVAELLQGLRHAHGLTVGGRPLGVIHRDISPYNVLVSAAGEVKLADFGIARVAGELSSGMYVKGRARYMAPEQARGEATQASDLFAIGAILHELLDGRPFRDDLRRRYDWHRVVSEAPLPPLDRRDVPPALEALRTGLLQADPSRRIATADDALRWLLRCPPWPPGAETLRAIYERSVGSPRRTGLTRPEPPSTGSAPTPRCTPGSAPHPRSAPHPGPAPHPGGSAVVRPHTATLPRNHGSSLASPSTSWASPSASRGTMPDRSLTSPLSSSARAPAMVRRRAPARPRPRRSARLGMLRWLGRGLWSLAGLFAVVAAGLAFSPARAGLPACIQEPTVPTDRQARIRLRGDDQPLAQVRIDMQVLGVAAGPECWISPGIHDLAWRSSPHEPWHPAKPKALVSAKEHLLRVGEDGLAISAYDP